MKQMIDAEHIFMMFTEAEPPILSPALRVLFSIIGILPWRASQKREGGFSCIETILVSVQTPALQVRHSRANGNDGIMTRG